MKKTYMQPTMDVAEIKMQTMIAGSPGSISDKEAGEGSSENPAGFSKRRGIFSGDSEGSDGIW